MDGTVCVYNITLVSQNPPNTLWGSVVGPPKGIQEVFRGANTDPHKVFFGRLGDIPGLKDTVVY